MKSILRNLSIFSFEKVYFFSMKIIAFPNMFEYGAKPNKKPSQKNDGFFMKQGELERKTF